MEKVAQVVVVVQAVTVDLVDKLDYRQALIINTFPCSLPVFVYLLFALRRQDNVCMKITQDGRGLPV